MSATVLPDSFLTLHYRLASADGEEFVSTFGLSPATLQMGSGQLAAPLEARLLGLAEGTRTCFELAPADAFGERNPLLVERIARSALPAEIELVPNTLVEFGTPDGGNFAGFLRELDAETALFDFNHPLAGRAIQFEVQLIGIL
ncbi:peptidylprolyl isomerase [Rhodocyclus tenuis]|uniref:Peptidyl-prolyl cis-trans isomerase n=1 Tax=Rhodocyclus tenuis TaxID=1066 RepID=A0A6L5JZI8_RHOTE|nr:FKBP-type peptidyl-prolyl cis-trans isomerase [Rhodocyclus gracilis]MQY51648.1 peptidylprolyl isomerase [Rhodocyclus gracilis]MRD73129.1 peptidylprolyl isomerase [Rhodocyclus gracilis]